MYPLSWFARALLRLLVSGVFVVCAAPAVGGAGGVTLSWEAPTTNSDGTPLTDLAGYCIYYGTEPTHLVHTIQINSVGIQTYVLDNLSSGTWYFAIIAVTNTGNESALSNIVEDTIT